MYPGADEAEQAGEDMDDDSKDRANAVAEQIRARVEAKAQDGIRQAGTDKQQR
jgi:vacuolar-type H+-ATPase subunit H